MSLRHIYIVVCNGISDIGKGWLTAGLCGLDLAHTLPIKIDPLLNLSFPQHLGVPIKELCDVPDIEAFIKQGRSNSGDFKISEDMATYHEAGVKVYPECNIVAGDLINRFLNSPNHEIRPGEMKKRTFSDLARFLASDITTIVHARQPETLIIEVGGTIEDHESVYIPSAIRFLGTKEFLGIIPEIVLLTFFEYAEAYGVARYQIKTQHIRRGIVQISQTYYHLPLRVCFVRRRNVPLEVEDAVLIADLRNAAYETQVPAEKIVLLPNVALGSLKSNLQAITYIIQQTGLFQ